MGLGKLAMQMFFMFPNIETCVGVELAASRFDLSVSAMEKLVQLIRQQAQRG
jgi:hypothetical protein